MVGMLVYLTRVYLTPLSCALKTVMVASFTLYIFSYNFKEGNTGFKKVFTTKHWRKSP